MKLTFKKVFLIFAVGLFFASCTKDKQQLFEEPTALYNYNFPDSMEFSFATTPNTVVADTIFINYRIIGNSVPNDRIINLQVRAGATAKAGYHYVLGPAVVKANEFAASVPVYLYRKPGLTDSTVQVIFDIKDNDDLKAGYPSKLRFKLTITDILKKPTNWDAVWKTYFGEYSEVKFRFLLSVTGRTDWNSYPFPGDSRFLAGRARISLLEYNQTYGPLIDENGEEVFFPS